MCHQAVSLVQGELERGGIVTASITMLPEITRKIQPPRALSVPFPLGFPMGQANHPELQQRILTQLLELCRISSVPVLVELAEHDQVLSPAGAVTSRSRPPDSQ